MIQVADGNIMKDSTVVLTPVRTPLEFLGSLLKLWCPSRGIGEYASGAAMISDLMTLTDAPFGLNATTTAGSSNFTLSSSVGGIGPVRLKINSVSRFLLSNSGTSGILNSIWMNEGAYPTSTTSAMFNGIIAQLNDKSGNSNHLAQSVDGSKPVLFLNNKRLAFAMGSTSPYLNTPLNLLNNVSKFLFGIKAVIFNINTTLSYVVRIRNNANTRDRFSVTVQQVSSKNVVTVSWDNGGAQYLIMQEIAPSTTFIFCAYFDFSINRLFLMCNEINNLYFAPSASAIDNNNANYSRIAGGGSNNSVVGAHYLDPVLATGSGLNREHLGELFDYYKYL